MQRTFPDGVTSWIDVEQPDETAAMQFYGDLFGWTFDRATPPEVPVPYWIARLDGRDVAGVGRADTAAWNTYVSVSDSEAVIARIEQAGGTVVSGPDAAGEGGLLQQIVARISARMPLVKGEVVRLTTTPDKVHVFDTTTGARLTA